jgi:DNA-binding LacI/PurR family transcriptional regulator
LAHVAELAGVHPATVSRVLTRPDLVGASTQDRVRAAIDSLGYVPHVGARQTAGGRSGIVAALVPDLANPFFASVLKAIQRALSDDGARLMVADTDLDADDEAELVRTFSRGVDAIIVCSPVGTTARLRALAGDRPLVFVNRSASSVMSVAIDQSEIVHAGVQHLRALGHTSICLLAGPDGYSSSTLRSRAAAVYDDVTILHGLPPSFDGGLEGFDTVMASGATAVLAFNDVMALGVLAAAHARGVRIPHDLSVVGSDDIPIAAMSTPALTTLVAPVAELGSVAAELVNAALAGDRPRSRTLPVSLIERASTAPPARTEMS